jgi:hypothetical protein
VLTPKACHQGLRPKANLFGLEPLDGLILFPVLYICTVLLGAMVWGVALTIVLAAILRLLKWNQLPGYSSALLLYLVYPPHNPVLGTDTAPQYPRGRTGGAS